MNRLASYMFTGLAVVVLGGCSKPSDDLDPPQPSWIVDSHVVFLEADGTTERSAPREALRLWMPYVVGDLWGDPNAGEILPVTLAPDLSFRLDLNLGHLRLEKALVPTAFSQKWLSIAPADARVARLSPWVLLADGIAPLGTCEWLDARTRERFLLVYFDRPARIRGEIVYEGRALRFDVEAPEAGYVWIRQPEGSGEYRAAPRPAELVLAVLRNP